MDWKFWLEAAAYGIEKIEEQKNKKSNEELGLLGLILLPIAVLIGVLGLIFIIMIIIFFVKYFEAIVASFFLSLIVAIGVGVIVAIINELDIIYNEILLILIYSTPVLAFIGCGIFFFLEFRAELFL